MVPVALGFFFFFLGQLELNLNKKHHPTLYPRGKDTRYTCPSSAVYTFAVYKKNEKLELGHIYFQHPDIYPLIVPLYSISIQHTV